MAGWSRALEAVGMTPGFWVGRRVFLTGHTGFKGGWLALWLEALGARVTGYALAPDTTPSLYETAGIDGVLTSVLGDVRDAAALTAAMAAAQPEVVLHLAAQPLVLASYDDPAGTWATNVMGTANLLEAVRRTPGVRAVVVVTTDKCYAPPAPPAGHREDDRLGGVDPYSASKAGTELVAASWRASFFPPAQYPRHGVALATVRAGNVIGGGDWSPHRLVPDLVAAFAAGRPALLRHPEAVRPWQHVLAPLHGYLLLAERLVLDGPSWGMGWNFGPALADAVPVREVAARLAAHWGPAARCALAPAAEAPHESPQLQLDSTLARTRLGWHPAWPLDEALRQVVAWEQARLAGQDMRAVCRRQIDAYLSPLPSTPHR